PSRALQSAWHQRSVDRLLRHRWRGGGGSPNPVRWYGVYAVSEQFMDQMRATVRKVLARVTIDYTDPTQDQTIEVTASEQANVSYPAQTADFATEPAHKWAALDGAWVLDGTWHLAPVSEDAYLYQMGWWSAQVAGQDGAFAEPYPT